MMSSVPCITITCVRSNSVDTGSLVAVVRLELTFAKVCLVEMALPVWVQRLGSNVSAVKGIPECCARLMWIIVATIPVVTEPSV